MTKYENTPKRVLVAMSGGVDSSVAALLLKQQGYEVSGATMKLFGGDISNVNNSDLKDAEAVAQKLDIPFTVFDFSKEFKQEVIDNFTRVYREGATPNPCIVCNRKLKFGRFIEEALKLGFDCIATGHYAIIGCENGRYTLSKGFDKSKDQSYVLYGLTQQQLAHTLFPLGEMTKEQVRKIAEENGLLNARKSESQDICFVPDGKYAQFIESMTGEKSLPGSFIDENGRKLGIHKGLVNYTIGQKKHLGICLNKPVAVCAKCAADNTITLSDEEALYKRELTATQYNLIAYNSISVPIRVKAKIRYRHTEQPATAEQLDSDTLKITFDEPQRAIAPGQSVVLYDGDKVIGGGIIA